MDSDSIKHEENILLEIELEKARAIAKANRPPPPPVIAPPPAPNIPASTISVNIPPVASTSTLPPIILTSRRPSTTETTALTFQRKPKDKERKPPKERDRKQEKLNREERKRLQRLGGPHYKKLKKSNGDGSSSGLMDEVVDEMLYCTCRRTSFGEMIACDNELCRYEWVSWTFSVSLISLIDFDDDNDSIIWNALD